ncbi:hypothetical protein COU60_00075 [Candidatus Pacearchaeota archaeon CG10_big_fil_rev_8_21_14_0_10_34_76]|nr:MAG: hypothetical protein COU60_00075 [Candidatus Pacearchaeota archaeon CG10_big_fil_rev_8_21_14_0_10_34_76]
MSESSRNGKPSVLEVRSNKGNVIGSTLIALDDCSKEIARLTNYLDGRFPEASLGDSAEYQEALKGIRDYHDFVLQRLREH